MKKTVFICDRCKKETPTLWDVYIPYKHSIYGVVSRQFELCPECTRNYIKNCFSFYSEEMKKEVKIT